MNLPMPEIHLGYGETHEAALELVAEGVLRYVWHGRFGDMLIEVRDGKAFVNGQPVEPAATEGQSLTMISRAA